MEEEWGSSCRFGLLDTALRDQSGKEIVVPRCNKCNTYKLMVIGKEAFCWHCPECEK